MPRQFRKAKPLIYVFCEGESEQAYTEFLKRKFENVAVIKYPSATGLFSEAKSKFEKDAKYRNNAEVIDEIWFFFDVEVDKIADWDKTIKIINYLRKLRKKPGIKVRLLMTSGCIEYWLMLHYKMFIPPVQTVADKERILSELITRETSYVKGNYTAMARIAEHYLTAVDNAEKTVKTLISEGLPGMEDTDLRNQWLWKSCKTFSNVYEAINFLEKLR